MKKCILLILSVIFLCSLISIFACNNSSSQEKKWEIVTVYAEAKELGYEGSLDEFIELISGKDGLGIKKVEIVNGDLLITYTDESSINLGKIRDENPSGLDFIFYQTVLMV